jgi:hypothetical protein
MDILTDLFFVRKERGVLRMKGLLPCSFRHYRNWLVEEALADVLVDRNQSIEGFLKNRLVGF